MLNITKSYAKIWEAEDMGRYVKGKIGTSRKNKQTDEWINSSWFCRFVGECTGLAKTLAKGDKIIITNATIESVYDKDKKITYTTVVIFEFERDGQAPPIDKPEFVPMDGTDDDLPF